MNDWGNLNPKHQRILANLVFISNLNFMLSRVEHEKCSLSSGPGHDLLCLPFRMHLFEAFLYSKANVFEI